MLASPVAETVDEAETTAWLDPTLVDASYDRIGCDDRYPVASTHFRALCCSWSGSHPTRGSAKSMRQSSLSGSREGRDMRLKEGGVETVAWSLRSALARAPLRFREALAWSPHLATSACREGRYTRSISKTTRRRRSAMASVAESSVASVPIPDLALLQEHLLRVSGEDGFVQRSCITDASTPVKQQTAPLDDTPQAANGGDPDDHDKSFQGGTHSSRREDVQLEIAESANAYRTPHSSPPAKAPRLTTSKSATAADMEATVQPSLSQGAFASTTRASSFHGFPGGDTQEMKSQDYRDYAESIAKRSATTPKKMIMMNVQISPDGKDVYTYDTTATDKTPKTCQEGDTGFVDLMGVLEQSSPIAPSLPADDELLASPQTQMHAPPKPSMPETPFIAGRKRNHDGEPVTTSSNTTKRTPGFTQLFGAASEGQGMTATQLFDQTQAPSSPTAFLARTGAVSDPPSPNFAPRVLTSPIADSTSSPELVMHARALATAGEPRDNYTSMLESQERRANFNQLPETTTRVEFDDDDEDEDYSQLRRQEQRRLQQLMNEQARSSLGSLRSPSRPGSRPGSSRKQVTTIDLVTPSTVRRGEHVDVDVLKEHLNHAHEAENVDDHEEDQGDAEDLPRIECEDDGREPDNDDDVYDEYGQTVLTSQGNIPEEDGEHASMADDSESRNADVNGDMEGEKPTSQAGAGTDAEHMLDRALTATQRSRIADSQTEMAGQSANAKHLLMNEQPGLSSFVPGSQHGGKTSQEKAQLAASSMRTASAPDFTHDRDQQRVPSSPPLPTASGTVPDDSAQASAMRQQALAQFQHTSNLVGSAAQAEGEIPESEALPFAELQPDSMHGAATAVTNGESNSVPLYSTARTHISASGTSPFKKSAAQSPFKRIQSQQSALSSQSPRRAAGVRKFADINSGAPPLLVTGETDEDIDAVMNEVVNADDHRFIEAISSPQSERPNKRRRLARTMKSASAGKQSESEPVPKLPETEVEAASNAPVAAIAPSPASRLLANHNHKTSKPLQSSPSKANELPAATPEDAAPLKGTQESAKKREEAGAETVTKLLSARSAKPVKSKRLAGTRGAVTEAPAVDEAPKAKPKSLKIKLKSTKRTVSDIAGDEKPEPDARPSVYQPVAASRDQIDQNVSASNRVFALFKGNFNNFYPATWLACSADGKTHRVRFNEGTVTSIETHQIRALDLRLGDRVKIDGPGMRNKTWSIQDFGLVTQTAEERAPGTDVSGHATLIVGAKTARDSAAAGSIEDPAPSDTLEVLIANIYLTHTMWPHFADRAFVPPPTSLRVSSRAATPSTGVQTPDVETPGSRSRRTNTATAKNVMRRSSHLRDDSTDSFRGPATSNLFDGMAFAISYGSNEVEKAEVTRQITRNGGIILENGFDELFDLPDFGEAVVKSPAKAEPANHTTLESKAPGLRLKQEYADMGFVALIADRHSRRAKYMQALALGLPTLSGRWITDAITAVAHHFNHPPQWSKYLLAAGESTYLNGAVRSRSLPFYPAAEARLTDTIANREMLLDGEGVLIVAPKKVKGALERRKAYAFLTLALGAGHLQRVADLVEARTLTAEEPEKWKWVYVDGSVVEASKALFCDHGEKKRKRDGSGAAAKTDGQVMYGRDGEGKVKVVNDEFVVQSLILGALID